MKLHSFVSFLLAFMASLFVAGCGGGGAAADPTKGGELQILPTNGTFYAGVASTINVQGGRAPYALTSSDPALLAVPAILNGHSFQVVPNNPGVVDADLTPDEVPSRTVIITVRDSQGLSEEAEIHVIRNFLTGYSLSFGATTCEDVPVCAGGDTVVQLSAITNGTLHGNEDFRFEMARSGCRFVDFDGTLKISIIVRSSHEGIAQALMRCPAGTTGIGLIRVTHVASGVTAEHAFVIASAGDSTGGMTADPDSLSFTGANSAQCGTGTADVLIFGGNGPYTASSSFPGAVSVTPTSSTSPGRFTITAFNPNFCVDAVVVVQDSSGNHVDIAVTTETGSGTPPGPPPFAVQPTAMTVNCSQTGSATAIGGSGSYTATSSHPRLVTTVSGGTISITRCGTASNPACVPVNDGLTVYPTTGTISVSDGTAFKTIDVTTQATCP